MAVAVALGARYAVGVSTMARTTPGVPSSQRPPPADPVLILDQVGRFFGGALALAPVSLQIGRGAMCVVTGPNGSGKSTLLRLAAGLLGPSTGTRQMNGRALYLAAGSGARHAQTVAEALSFVSTVSGAPAELEHILNLVGLTGLGSKAVRTLSAGERARVTLAVALAARPDLVCLDEPTAHLDGDGVGVAARAVHELALRGAAVVVATHDTAWLPGDARLSLEEGRLVVPA